MNNYFLKIKKGISEKENPKPKYLNTESNSKIKDFLSSSSVNKDIIHKFNYKLYKLNEQNKMNNINYSLRFKKEDLLSGDIDHNINKIISIKNLKEYHSNSNSHAKDIKFIKTTNFFYPKNPETGHSAKNLKNILYKNNYLFKYFSPKSKGSLPLKIFNLINNNKINRSLNKSMSKYKDRSNKKDNSNTSNKISLCLVPLIGMNKYRIQNKNNNKNYISNNAYSEKNTLYGKVVKTEPNSKKVVGNDLLRKNRKIYKKYMMKENDMEPKFRFTNIKKELLQETLKINKMFNDFNKQISDKEKTIRFIGRHKDKHQLMKEDININNKFS
jgi:hypothetical protein